MMLPTFQAFAAHAFDCEPRECCGLIVRVDGEERYRPCENTAPQPEDHFQIREEDWIESELMGEVLAVCHSHPGAAPDPGQADLDGVQEHGLPWFILGRGDALQRVDPEIPSLTGRPFVYGWQDCYTLARDWFWITRGVRLLDFPREEKFWDGGRSPYLDRFEAFGFEAVEDLQAGDALLMRVGESKIPNHAAIYVGNGQIIHHLWNRLSSMGFYDGRLQRATTHILRLR